MVNGRLTLIVAVLLVPVIAACTVMQLKKEVESDEVRLASKEEDLKTEEARQAKLQEDITALQHDLATRQLSLDDLKSRLAQLEQANANTLASTEEQRARKRLGEKKLKAHQKEVVEIQESGATLAEKKRRVEHLRKEIRKSLASLVHS